MKGLGAELGVAGASAPEAASLTPEGRAGARMLLMLSRAGGKASKFPEPRVQPEGRHQAKGRRGGAASGAGAEGEHQAGAAAVAALGDPTAHLAARIGVPHRVAGAELGGVDLRTARGRGDAVGNGLLGASQAGANAPAAGAAAATAPNALAASALGAPSPSGSPSALAASAASLELLSGSAALRLQGRLSAAPSRGVAAHTGVDGAAASEGPGALGAQLRGRRLGSELGAAGPDEARVARSEAAAGAEAKGGAPGARAGQRRERADGIDAADPVAAERAQGVPGKGADGATAATAAVGVAQRAGEAALPPRPARSARHAATAGPGGLSARGAEPAPAKGVDAPAGSAETAHGQSANDWQAVETRLRVALLPDGGRANLQLTTERGEALDVQLTVQDGVAALRVRFAGAAAGADGELAREVRELVKDLVDTLEGIGIEAGSVDVDARGASQQQHESGQGRPDAEAARAAEVDAHRRGRDRADSGAESERTSRGDGVSGLIHLVV
jgi:hypothetical protein